MPMFSYIAAGSRSYSAQCNGRIRVLVCMVVLVMLPALGACSSFGLRATATPTQPTATPAPPTDTPEPMAATVNGEGITIREFTAQLAQYKSAQASLGKTATEQDATKAVLDDLISELLLAQGAHAEGFTMSDATLQAKLNDLQNKAGGADQLTKWEQNNGYATPEDFRVALLRSLEAAWMRDKIVSAVPQSAEQVHVQQILLYNEADAASVLDQLKAGTDFGTLAAQYDPNTSGDLGWFPKGYLLEPKIEEAAFSLQVGQYSDVIQTDAGYSIIKLLERDPNRPLSPDARLALQQLALQDWITKTRATAKVTLAP